MASASHGAGSSLFNLANELHPVIRAGLVVAPFLAKAFLPTDTDPAQVKEILNPSATTPVDVPPTKTTTLAPESTTVSVSFVVATLVAGFTLASSIYVLSASGSDRALGLGNKQEYQGNAQ